MSQGGIPWWLSDKEVLVTQSHPTLSDPMDYSPVQAPLSMELSRQQNWSRLSFLSSGDLPDPAIKLVSLSLMHWEVGSLPLMPLIFSSSDCS